MPTIEAHLHTLARISFVLQDGVFRRLLEKRATREVLLDRLAELRGIKAGLWPLHGWLPQAHPAAPSPVSALMSGVSPPTLASTSASPVVRPIRRPSWTVCCGSSVGSNRTADAR